MVFIVSFFFECCYVVSLLFWLLGWCVVGAGLLDLVVSLFTYSLLITRRRPVRGISMGNICLVPSGVPRCPNNIPTVVGFLSSGIGCPIRTRGGTVSKHIVIRFMIVRSKALDRTGMVENISPLLSRRTLHIMGRVPG